MDKKQKTLSEIAVYLAGRDSNGHLIISEASVSRYMTNCGIDYKKASLDEIRHAVFLRLSKQAVRGVPDEHNKDIEREAKELQNKLTEEKIRLTASQADDSELKVNLKSRIVAPLAAMELAISKVATNAAAKLEQIPIRIKRKLPKITAKELDIISKEIIAVQNEVAEIEISEDDLKNGLEIAGL